jgi:predicted CXXCH cytochrome family protein
MKVRVFCLIPLILSQLCVAAELAGELPEYVGAAVCAECHNSEYNQWQGSDHFKAMEIATVDSVLGDFSGLPVEFHNIENRFFLNDGKFFIETGGEEFEIKYVFGHYPLQQYLVELEDGHVQALNTAWDSRSEEENGQRWFHLQPDEKITPNHPFYWKNHFQNWNARCADCHSTNLVKNYDRESHAYKTTWSDINVACESCHGPGSGHVKLVSEDRYSESETGLVNDIPAYVQWSFNEEHAIASPAGEKSDHHVDMCGSCHSLRTQLSTDTVAQGYHDSNRIQLLNEGSYYADGQIREEVYVLGSFMQSKMYEKGVTCTNCHNPHSGKLVAEGNGLCSQCHKAEVYDAIDHHHHEPGNEGAQCVSCHMPERTYMQVDERRDHSFTTPRPGISAETGVPNACTGCHLGRSDQWARDALTEWGIDQNADHWATVSQRAQDGDILTTRPLTNLIKEGGLPSMVAASLLEQLAPMPSRVSVETAQALLENDNPLLRRAAVNGLQYLPGQLRWEILSPYISDPSRSVRYEIAENLLVGYSDLFPEQQAQLDPLLSEYRKMLDVSADSPATQLAIANLELSLRNLVAAEGAYLHALEIEPGYVPALINLADYYRDLGRESKVEPLLKKALDVAPDSGGAQHSYGLHLVRMNRYDEAVSYLARAAEMVDAQPRYAYVYAIALENTGNVREAINVLAAAAERWPNQYDLLMTLVIFMDKTGKTDGIYKYISALTAIAPNSPEVKQLVQKYGN